MAFQSPLTIRQVLARISKHEYVLPAIQREFVWSPAQICRLFDSLMVGFPIGSFLFWRVARESVKDYKFFDFVREYHQKNAPHCPPLDVPGDSAVVAVLDGQQRLTALNIGLRGSHAEKQKNKWRNNPDAYPTRHLYLNLLGDPPEDEQGLQHEFRFLTEKAATERDDQHHWFPARRILTLEAGPDLHGVLVDAGLGTDKRAFWRLDRLHRAVHADGTISYYDEEGQDLDKVLRIFIRVNSGGTPLSYSDLLLSVATAQWEHLDARREVHRLVDDLNDPLYGFNFSRDFVLKAALMIADIPDVRFKVTNFKAETMQVLQEKWSAIRRTLLLTVRLVAGYGLKERTLSADNALLPIAYHLGRRELSDSFLTADRYREDRIAMRSWLVRALLKAGVWGAGVDTLLLALRGVVHKATDGFPLELLEAEMARRGRVLRFEEEELQDLADLAYGDSASFLVLSLLYQEGDARYDYHVDHVFPQSLFRKAALEKAGIPKTSWDDYREKCQRLANLRLLEGVRNEEKQAQLPLQWLRSVHAGREDALAREIERHDLHGLPEDLRNFGEFYERRRERMLERLRSLLGAKSSGS